LNERIKELAEQAGLRFTQLMSNPMVPVVDGKETDLEKFAELIVRECAEVGSKFSQAHPLDIQYQIKRHFGVEE
jgi:hypothetical protein